MKKLSARTGSYQKDGQTKGRFVNYGVLIDSDDGGQYILLDPCIDSSTVLQLQNNEAIAQGKPLRDKVMIGAYQEENQAQQPQQNQQQQQQQPQQNQSAVPQQQQQQPQPNIAPQNQPFEDEFDSDIPF